VADVAGRETNLRARSPDRDGYVERGGVKLFYEVFGEGDPTVFLLPTWSLIHSRHWKMQIPYLARHYRVVTFDGRGNGKSDRPQNSADYADQICADDCVAVMDETGIARATLVAFSLGCHWAVMLAAQHPDRVDGAVLIGSGLPVVPGHTYRAVYDFNEVLNTDDGWAKYNRHFWMKDYPGFVNFFMSQMFTEPHSTKQIEDTIGWGLETDAPTLLATDGEPFFTNKQDVEDALTKIECPLLVIHGDEDAIAAHDRAVAFADFAKAPLVTLQGSGHAPHARDPVKVNLLIRDFMERKPTPAVWTRGRDRHKRALFISSPIGLGHAQRDVAIAQELRALVPDLQIDWLAQDPVTRVLEGEGESIHPASRWLSNESQHIESESAEHDLHCFQAWRRMDEILLANFMVFHDIARDENYDLWIGDEAWELDYYLHENPEEKRAAYCWLTDFVGWLPMPDGGERESNLTTDYNAEMIEHIARFPRLRDRAIFVGNPADIVPDDFGRDLPNIREWTEEHYSFSGYITGFNPAEFSDREAIRAELGYGADEAVCIVTVGGSAVGEHLLRQVAASFESAKRDIGGLRMIIVVGPRISPDSLPESEGLEVLPYVHNLYRHLAACDLAIVQGGLTTSMELTANKRPFLYFPLRQHFEQNFHVKHRLEHHGAGRCMDYETATPEIISMALAEEIGKAVDYRPVETDGATRAAGLIAEMI
jgi:pimeloyl-ACP methyl ester carboxylesterase/predicted glycosyltransferase